MCTVYIIIYMYMYITDCMYVPDWVQCMSFRTCSCILLSSGSSQTYPQLHTVIPEVEREGRGEERERDGGRGDIVHYNYTF